MSNYLDDAYEPLNVSAAPPGWRAFYVTSAEPGFFTLPVVGWGVWRVSAVRSGNREPVPGAIDEPNVLAAAVINSDGWLACALDFEGFWMYLAPETPDPEGPPERTTRPGRGSRQ